jgi:hypothetical protein
MAALSLRTFPNSEPPGCEPGGCKTLSFGGDMNRALEAQSTCTTYRHLLATARLTWATMAKLIITLAVKATGWRLLSMLQCIAAHVSAWRLCAAMTETVISFPALAVTVTGPAAEKIRLAAAMYGKTPEAYSRDYLYWLAAIDLEGR